jgi:hypothetical protein
MKTFFIKIYKSKLFMPGLWLLVASAMIAGIIIEHPQVLSGSFVDQAQKPTVNTFVIPSPTDMPAPTIEEEPVGNTDPIVKCQLMECGTIEMKSSQCRLSGCCIIGSEAKVMTDRSECTRLQNEYAAKNTGSTNSLPSQKDLILQNAQNNAKYIGAQICLQQAKDESDRCLDQCLSESNEGSSACRAAADNLGWTTEKFSECLNESSAIHDQCGDNCLNTFNSKQNECLEKQKQ